MLVADLVPLVAVELPGCDDFVIERMYREELANLYRNYPLWLHTAAPTIAATTGVVSFTLPAQTEVHEIRSMRVGDKDVTPVGAGAVNDDYFDTAGDPQVVFLENFQWVTLPAPSAELTTKAVLQIGPIMAATAVDDNLAGRHRTLWEHLVLARLQSQAGQKWTNLKGASVHAQEATRLVFEERRRMDGWSARRAPVMSYGGL